MPILTDRPTRTTDDTCICGGKLAFRDASTRFAQAALNGMVCRMCAAPATARTNYCPPDGSTPVHLHFDGVGYVCDCGQHLRNADGPGFMVEGVNPAICTCGKRYTLIVSDLLNNRNQRLYLSPVDGEGN